MIEESKTTLGGLLDDAILVQKWDNSWGRKLLNSERTIWQMEKNIPQVVDLSNQLRQRMDDIDVEGILSRINGIDQEISESSSNFVSAKSQCQEMSITLDALLAQLREMDDETIPLANQSIYELELKLKNVIEDDTDPDDGGSAT